MGTVFLPQQWANKVITFYQCALFRQTLARLQQISWSWAKVITFWKISVWQAAHTSEMTPAFPGVHKAIAKTQEVNYCDLTSLFLMASDILGWVNWYLVLWSPCTIAMAWPHQIPEMYQLRNEIKLCWCLAPHGPKEIRRTLEVNPPPESLALGGEVADTLWERACNIRFAITSKIFIIINFFDSAYI